MALIIYFLEIVHSPHEWMKFYALLYDMSNVDEYRSDWIPENKRNTSRLEMAVHEERGSTPASLKRFWRSESFLRLERWAIRGSNVDKRLAVRSNSVRLVGMSTESRSWSWQLVRSRYVCDGDDEPCSAAAVWLSVGSWLPSSFFVSIDWDGRESRRVAEE